MKKLFIQDIYIFLFVFSVLSIQIAAENIIGIPIQEQTFLVYRRYYFVARLDKTIKLLAKMYQEVSSMQDMLAKKNISFEQIVPQESYKLFTHKQIRRSVKEIVHTRSLKPLFMVWDSFKSYKSLHDELLVEDFSKEIFIITHNTIDNLRQQEAYRMSLPDISKLSIEERLNVLSDMTYILEDCIAGTHNRHYRNAEMGEIHLAVQTDEIAFRFYCIHRLRAAFDWLLSRSESHCMEHAVYPVFQKKFYYMQNMAHNQSSFKRRIELLWDDLKQYKYIENDRFVYNVAVLVLTALRAEIADTGESKRLTQADVIALHNTIEQLPLEEILQTIDLIVKQVNNVVNHYHKSGLTFGQWLKQYWWAPPMIVTTIAIKCFLLYYKNSQSTA